MLNLTELILGSSLPLSEKLFFLTTPPRYFADGLADHLAEVEQLPRPSLLSRGDMVIMKRDISFLFYPVALVQIPFVSLEKISDDQDDRTFYVDGNGQRTVMEWRLGRAYPGYEQMLETEGCFAGKTYVLDMMLLFEENTRRPVIRRVHQNPLNPKNLKRLEKEGLEGLIPQYV